MNEKVAIYLRSSVQQNEKMRSAANPDESDTIANQRKLLRDYAEQMGLGEYRIEEYVDDGRTGTNFERPAFARLIEDAKAGKIRAVIVKDFSRLGRDYIGVGDYAEQLFPGLGIRLISVNDDWDSEEHPGRTLELDAGFRTILYEMYSRDLSKKAKSSAEERGRRGIYTSYLPPYGYRKDPEDIHHLIIDEDEAKVVRRIYREAISGTRLSQISRMLTAENIPTPSERNLMEGKRTGRITKAWNPETVRIILQNEMYTGTMILRRWESIYGKRSQRKRDPSEWKRFPGRHEPIVSREEFGKAQLILRKKRPSNPGGVPGGLPLYCGCCGKKLAKTNRSDGAYRCLTSDSDPYAVCGNIFIIRSRLIKLLMEEIEANKENLRQTSDPEEAVLSREEMAGRKLRKDAADLDHIKKERKNLYESYREDQISREEFLKSKNELMEKEQLLTEEVLSLRAKAEESRKQQRACEDRSAAGISFPEKEQERIIRSRIDRIEVFPDGRITARWKAGEGSSPDIRTIFDKPEEPGEKIRALLYSSDMRLMEEDDHGMKNRGDVLSFCAEGLGLRGDEIHIFYDCRNENDMFFAGDFMRMITAAWTGNHECIVINSFEDLYLTQKDLYNLLHWVIPKLPCRFISIRDGFDSAEDAEGYNRKADEIYLKYKGQRRSDLRRAADRDRKEGRREAKPPDRPKCDRVFGYISDDSGCRTDREILKVVKSMYNDVLSGASYAEICRHLTSEDIPTPCAYYEMHGMRGTGEKEHVWIRRRVKSVLLNPAYVRECRYLDICERLGRRCERHPIITKKDFSKANKGCSVRKL